MKGYWIVKVNVLDLKNKKNMLQLKAVNEI